MIVLRYLWALPNSLLGVLIVPFALLTRGGRIQIVDGVLEVCGSLPALLLRNCTALPGGVAAITFGHVVIGRDELTLDATRRHERVHVEQYGRWGPAFIPAYLIASALSASRGTGGYHGNYFERDAVQTERRLRAMVTNDGALRLRIRVANPPAGVLFRLQRGARELDAPIRESPRELMFEFDVRVGQRADALPNFLGPFTQGPPAARFVYINSGTYAGQTGSPWSRRAKVALTNISWALIRRAQAADGVLELEFPGTGSDGGPTCASVKQHSGWRLASQTEVHRRR